MSRVINPDSAGKERNHLTRSIVLAIRELMKQTQPDQYSKDLAAFIALSLSEIADTIDVSVAAWEKRGYWVKAERFRMEWEWAGRLGREMRKALQGEDWAAVAGTAATVAQKLMKIQIPARHRLGTPWDGAWEAFQKSG
ncbi:MAG TPA: hypothetical protein VF823_08010 [Anaerolineales bacterium]